LSYVYFQYASGAAGEMQLAYHTIYDYNFGRNMRIMIYFMLVTPLISFPYNAPIDSKKKLHVFNFATIFLQKKFATIFGHTSVMTGESRGTRHHRRHGNSQYIGEYTRDRVSSTTIEHVFGVGCKHVCGVGYSNRYHSGYEKLSLFCVGYCQPIPKIIIGIGCLCQPTSKINFQY
jgi:hypothetical protein